MKVFDVSWVTPESVFHEMFWKKNFTAGADPADVIRGGPNSERFLSNLRKLLKRGKFFLTTQSLIVKRNWVYINQFIKKRLLTWYFSGWFLFKNKARGGSENFEKGGWRANMVRYGILHDHTSKKRKIESTPLYSTFKLKYRKNVKLTIFLMGTSVKARK